MTPNSSITLRSPNSSDGGLGFRVIQFDDDRHFNELQRVPYFTIILISEGEGKLNADFAVYEVSSGAILFFSPYQPFMIEASILRGVMINFHPDFFCIFRHQNEVASEGILFNDPIHPPFFYIPETERPSVYNTIEQMAAEMHLTSLAQQDLLIAYLKILFIRAIRIKHLKSATFLPLDQSSADANLLRQLRKMIEVHFRTMHNGGEYADLLNIPLKTLGRIVKKHFQRTLTEIIAERIVMEAKRELNFTSRTIKEIAFDLGFDDKYHFSRYFKNKTGISPQTFRISLRKEAAHYI